MDNKCNCCVKTLNDKEDYAYIVKDWGYYSNGKDLTRQTVRLCEDCWDKLMDSLKIKPDEQDIDVKGNVADYSKYNFKNYVDKLNYPLQFECCYLK